MYLCRKGKEIDTIVFTITIKADVYLNWNTFAPISWKRGTLQTIIKSAYLIHSTDILRNRMLKHIEHVLVKTKAIQKMLYFTCHTLSRYKGRPYFEAV